MAIFNVRRQIDEGTTVEAQFDDLKDVKAFLADNLTGDESEPTKESVAEEPKAAAKKPGRPKGATKKSAAKKTAPKAASKDSKISDEELRLELNKIVKHDAGGGPMAKEFLGKHSKVSEVPQDERQPMIDAIAERLAELDGGDGESDESDDDFLE